MSDGAAASLDVGSLKVAELKEELAKRDLPTNGLKKDLASRLEEALASRETAKAEETRQVDDNDGGKVVEEGDKSEVETEQQEEKRPATVEAEASEVKQDTTSIESEDAQQDEASKAEEQETTQPSLIARITGEADRGKDVAPTSDEQVEEKEVEMTDGVAESSGTSLQDRMGEIAQRNDEDVIDLGGELEEDVEMPSGEAAPASPLASRTRHLEIPASSESSVLQMDVEKEEVPLHHRGGLSPISDHPPVLSVEQTASTKALSELNEEEVGLEKPSRSIYITGLVRPLTLPSFKAKAEEFGDLGGEGIEEGHEVWLDGVKSHAYVTYREEQSAVVAKAALSGSVYPPETGKLIHAFFVPENIVKFCRSIEEKAWDVDRGRLELRARLGEGGDALSYSLHRIDTSSTVVRRLDTTLPQSSSSRSGHNNSSQRGASSGRPFRPGNRPTPSLEWGGPSSSHHRFVDSRTYNGKDRFLRDERYDRGSSQRGERGPSQADDRVRQVEARIRASRERGFVNGDNMNSHPRFPPRRDYYEGDSGSRQADATSRWSDDRYSTARTAYGDRNSRNLSPPPKRRDYSRDDRSRRDW